MTVRVVTFFNNKGGVGKTSLVLHLAWMLAEMGRQVIAIDLDPQANLTSGLLPEDVLEDIWNPDEAGPRTDTIFQCIRPLTEMGDILSPATKAIAPGLHLVPGDLRLASFEEVLSQEWPNALGSTNLVRPFRILTSFWQVAQDAARQHRADIILADVGPHLGAINRSALIATDFVIIPLAADLFSLQGLRNLGPSLRHWRMDWRKRLDNWRNPTFALPSGRMQPVGYIMLQHSERLGRTVRAYEKWAERIPQTYAQNVLDGSPGNKMEDDRLANLKHYRSLMPMAQERRKPIFKLSSADGAIGSHSYAVKDAHADFIRLATSILARIDEDAGPEPPQSPGVDEQFQPRSSSTVLRSGWPA